jgi:hypothetical protein
MHAEIVRELLDDPAERFEREQHQTRADRTRLD